MLPDPEATPKEVPTLSAMEQGLLAINDFDAAAEYLRKGYPNLFSFGEDATLWARPARVFRDCFDLLALLDMYSTPDANLRERVWCFGMHGSVPALGIILGPKSSGEGYQIGFIYKWSSNNGNLQTEGWKPEIIGLERADIENNNGRDVWLEPYTKLP